MSVTNIEISVDDPTQQDFILLYKKLESLDSESGLTSHNIAGIVISLMQFVQTIVGMNGKQKKNLVLSVLKKRVEEAVPEMESQRDLLLFIDATLPSVIDGFIALNNGELKIKIKNKIVKIIKKCFSCF